jgi:hypothetical protein
MVAMVTDGAAAVGPDKPGEVISGQPGGVFDDQPGGGIEGADAVGADLKRCRESGGDHESP